MQNPAAKLFQHSIHTGDMTTAYLDAYEPCITTTFVFQLLQLPSMESLRFMSVRPQLYRF